MSKRTSVRPRGIHGGRVGCSNGSSNGDPFLDDLVDIGQDIGEGNKAVVRSRGIHRGRCGSSSSSAIGEGNLVADKLYKESSQCRRGSNIVDTPPTESSHMIGFIHIIMGMLMLMAS
ncbi:hypothetical protein Tco_1555391 [Tanacetum coccineum]